MSVSISRLRIWFGVMTALVVAVVAGFYLYARVQLHISLKNLPGKVGIDIQQTTDGFSFSKSEGGRTLFSVHASKATQYKGGGRAELHDVNIIVYGHNSDRYDQIYSNEFEFDQKAGTIIAKGEVHIDLEGNSEGRTLDDQAAPREMQNPIHLRAQGLTFNQQTGIAETTGKVDFHIPQASGSALGATYDAKKNELVLQQAVEIDTEGARATHISASRGVITKEPRVLELSAVSLTGDDRTLHADLTVLDLTEQNSIESVHASGNVRLADASGVSIRAPRAEVKLAGGQTLEAAHFFGGVDFDSERQGASGRSGEMLLHFVSSAPSKPGRNKTDPLPTPHASAQLSGIDASHGVIFHRDAVAGAKNAQQVELKSDAMTFAVADGKLLTSGETRGPGQLTMTSVAAASKGEQTVMDAAHFLAEFGEQNQLRTVHGSGGVKVTSRMPGQPDKLSQSNTLTAQFTGAGEISHIVQEGGFRYSESQSSSKEPGGRTSYADRATYSPQDDALTLQGSPRIVDGGMTVTADSIRLLRKSGEAFAQGNVKTTYSELKMQPNGALLATSDPIHVTAHAMNAQQLNGVAHYTGGARLWQGSNIVEAATIDFDQRARTIQAQGDRRHPVSSVFLQVDNKGKATTMLVTAPHLTYTDGERRARYSGGVIARGEEITLTADHLDVLLNPFSASRPNAPSQLESIVAFTRVVVQQLERRAEGEKLVYTAASGTFVMSGGTPSLSDPANGVVRGDSLTFYSHDDRVVVEANGSSRTVTRTHVSR